MTKKKDMEKTVSEAESAIWKEICDEATEIVENERELGALFDDVVVSKDTLFEAITARLARKLGRFAMPEERISHIIGEVFFHNPCLRAQVLADLVAIKERDPACNSFIQPLFYYKGFHAITVHRIAHSLWNDGRKHLAYYLQSLSSEVFAVDIHPAAKFGGGILLDHATSFVAGETSVVDDNVSILHEVTLGGTGNELGDRHPKVKSGVLIGAGAKLIGNITIGKGAKIGAGSVVLHDFPEHTAVAGVPAKPIGETSDSAPYKSMNQLLNDCFGK